MKWKRNISSYPFWGLMILIGLAGLVMSTIDASVTFGANEVVGAVICIVLLTLAGSGTYFLHLYKAAHPEENEYPLWGYCAFGIILLGCFAGGVVFAVMNIPDAELTSPYFLVSKVQAGCRAPYFIHGATNTYIAFLNKVFFFFGNRALIGVYAQIVLWVLIVLCIGAGLWCAVSKKSAVVVMMLAMLMPALRQEAVVMSPVLLLLLFWSAIFAWICFSERLKKREIVIGVNCFLIGLCTYFDLSGLLLLPIFLTIMLRKKSVEQNNGYFGKILVNGLIGAVAACIGFFACIFADASFSEKAVGAVLRVWFTTYSASFQSPTQLLQAVSSLEYIPVYFLICLGAFAFWREKKQDLFKGWLVQILFVLVFFVGGLFSERVTGYAFFALLLFVLAGVSLEALLAVVENVPDEKKSVEETKPEKKETNKQKVHKLPKFDDIDSWIPLEEETTVERKTEEKEVAKAEPEPKKENTEKEIKFLDNPLPLPKKHEKRAVDFPISSSADDDYDYAVAEDDDYDIP